VTHLRRIMLEELQRRNYADSTARYYVRAVEQFARHFGKSPDKLGLEHLRTYQAYLLKQRKLAVGTVVSQVAALRFFFVRTLKRHEFREFLPYPRERQRLPRILSKEEVARLINSSGNLFQRRLLMVLYGTGPRTCWKPELICARFRFCSDTKIWRRRPSISISRSGTCSWFITRSRSSRCPASMTVVAPFAVPRTHEPARH
jgi:site-specific recombinase XerD